MAVGASCRTMIQTTFNELYAINTHVPFVRHLVVDWKICKLCSFFRYSRLECQLNLLVFIFNHVSFPFTRIALDHLEHSEFPLCGFRTLVSLLNVLIGLIEMFDYTVEVRNRFKGLDLIDRVPDELWVEVHDIVQETGIKTIPKKKKCKKANWLSEEALQIAVKRREVKSKGEKEIYTH